MRLLILSSNEVGDLTSGQGVIVTHTVQSLLARSDVQIGVGVFRALPIGMGSRT